MHNLRRATITRSPSGDASIVVTRSAFRKQAVHFIISLLLTCGFFAAVAYQTDMRWILHIAISTLIAAPLVFLLYARSPRSMRVGATILSLREGFITNRWGEKVPWAGLESISVVRLRYTWGKIRWEEFILLNDRNGPVLAVDHRSEYGTFIPNDLPELTCSLTGLKYQVIRGENHNLDVKMGLHRFRKLW
ncbi:MAG: hypothetical protein KF712_01995 [Akkermansiaceae bacterium]|nr:hypothetical protein [Akkermansiaceae bacterium]